MQSTEPMTAIIPARSGSQRLKNKNIRPINGKPLIFYTIEAFLSHDAINKVLFTSDSHEYCNIVEKAFTNSVKIIHRPEYTATNTAKVVEEIDRLLRECPEEFGSNWFMVGLPTAPFRSSLDVGKLISYWQAEKKGCFAASAYEFPTQFAFNISETVKSGRNWQPVLGEASPMITGNTRSQEIPATYRPNGSIYLTSKESFLKRKLLYDDCDAVLLDKISGFDIDTELDFKIA